MIYFAVVSAPKVGFHSAKMSPPGLLRGLSTQGHENSLVGRRRNTPDSDSNSRLDLGGCVQHLHGDLLDGQAVEVAEHLSPIDVAGRRK